jgi:hypothetical protein
MPDQRAPVPPFRVRPVRIERIRAKLDALAIAPDPAAALGALFLLQAAVRDCLKDIPEQPNEEAKPL